MSSLINEGGIINIMLENPDWDICRYDGQWYVETQDQQYNVTRKELFNALKRLKALEEKKWYTREWGKAEKLYQV